MTGWLAVRRWLAEVGASAVSGVLWLTLTNWLVRAGVAALAGVVAALGFQPFNLWPLTVLGVAGLTWLVRTGGRARSAAGNGVVWGLGFLGVNLWWVQLIFVQAMVGLVALESVFYLLLGLLIWAARGTRWWPLLAAGCWSIIEFSFSRFPFNGFGWTRLAYSMVDSPLAWSLPLVGVAGLSFLTALLGQGLVWLSEGGWRACWRPAGIGLASILAISVGGALVPVGAAGDSLRVGYVQGGAPGGGVYGIGGPRTTTANHLAEVRRLATKIDAGELPRPDFVLLPENTTDLDPLTDAQTGVMVREMSSRLGVPMLLGVIADGPTAAERQTESVWWTPEDGPTAGYVKRAIVPFGEWVPMRSFLLPLIPELAFVGRQSVAGQEPGVLPVQLQDGRAVQLGILICYDLLYDDFNYELPTNGAQVILTQSSNAMYQGTGQIDQQFAISRARALELRREMLVVTTSGVSGLINADGNVAFTAPLHDGASGVVELPQRSGSTPATWLALPLQLAIVGITLLALIRLRWYGRMERTKSRIGGTNRQRRVE